MSKVFCEIVLFERVLFVITREKIVSFRVYADLYLLGTQRINFFAII